MKGKLETIYYKLRAFIVFLILFAIIFALNLLYQMYLHAGGQIEGMFTLDNFLIPGVLALALVIFLAIALREH